MTITMTSTQFCSVCDAANKHGDTHCFACAQLLATGTQYEALLHKRYQLSALLGLGGFSVVYRARDLLSGRDMVIKQVTLRGLST